MADHIDLTQPVRLLPAFRERVWGVDNLAHWFPEAPAKTIGEAWFTAEENQTNSGLPLRELLQQKPEILGSGCHHKYPELCPLLVKLLFTSSRLSVQVHPKDDYAEKHHQSLGKTEAWFVIDAQPGAEVALGFREQISPERMRAAAESGEIEQLLDWKPVQAGDIVFVPAGTVHAIGAGLTICEIQQNSDITYRLYDYGRPRELHLDHGSAVSDLGPYVHHFNRKELSEGRLLVAESQYFRIEHICQNSNRGFQLAGGAPHYSLLISLRGEGSIAGQPFHKGQVWLVPARSGPVDIQSEGSEWLLTYVGTEPPPALHFV
jgi:mannose-6-phosphate isomerase